MAEGTKINVPIVNRWVRVILADMRGGGARRVEMVGRLNIPGTVYTGQVYVNWNLPELTEPLRGVACDVQAEGCTLCFAIVDDDMAISKLSGKPVSLDDLRLMFQKYDPTLEVTLKK